jgi:hypothetical protein
MGCPHDWSPAKAATYLELSQTLIVCGRFVIGWVCDHEGFKTINGLLWSRVVSSVVTVGSLLVDDDEEA